MRSASGSRTMMRVEAARLPWFSLSPSSSWRASRRPWRRRRRCRPSPAERAAPAAPRAPVRASAARAHVVYAACSAAASRPQYVYVPAGAGPHPCGIDYVHAPRITPCGSAAGSASSATAAACYTNPTPAAPRPTGNFVTNGLALEVDVGARVARRYIPYLGAGARPRRAPGTASMGTDAKAGTSFFGSACGSWRVTSTTFLRLRPVVRLPQDPGLQRRQHLERLGLRVPAPRASAPTSACRPLHALADADALGRQPERSRAEAVTYAPDQGDGLPGTPFAGEHGQIPSDRSRTTPSSSGCGAHFDLFGEFARADGAALSPAARRPGGRSARTRSSTGRERGEGARAVAHAVLLVLARARPSSGPCRSTTKSGS